MKLIEILNNRYLMLAFRLIIGFVFIFAGLEKISEPERFAVSIENYRIIPVLVINIFAVFLPFLELITGLLLIFGISIRENIIIINSLLVLFIMFVLIAIIRGLDIECGCFGTADGQKVGLQKIVENIFLFVIGLAVYIYDKRPIKIGKQF